MIYSLDDIFELPRELFRPSKYSQKADRVVDISRTFMCKLDSDPIFPFFHFSIFLWLSMLRKGPSQSILATSRVMRTNLRQKTMMERSLYSDSATGILMSTRLRRRMTPGSEWINAMDLRIVQNHRTLSRVEPPKRSEPVVLTRVSNLQVMVAPLLCFNHGEVPSPLFFGLVHLPGSHRVLFLSAEQRCD
jgi:hypothetical protein